MDIISSIELPAEIVTQEPHELYQYDYVPIVNDTLDKTAPLATVLDSGVFTGNPLLKSVVVAEEDFDTTEHATADMNGHGTGVAGIVVYGDFSTPDENRIYTPLVRICSAKIMHDEDGDPCFREDVRPEKLVKDAIVYFYKTYGCRIFNLSAGDVGSIYNGGRQLSWASMLDDLARELDIVIIVSAGNVSDPEIPEFESRKEAMEKVRDQLFAQEHRLIDPATSALSVTVGSISRFSEPAVLRSTGIGPISVGLKDYPSVFTRIGKGVNKSIKPDFVDYGGNFSLRQIARGTSRWLKTDQKLMEPTLNHTNDRVFKGYCGTSFAAPHVTHIAARLERILETQIDGRPSANLIRAMLANSARCSNDMQTWGEMSKDANYTGKDNPKHDRFMRLYGYGKISEQILTSTDNHVTLLQKIDFRYEIFTFIRYLSPNSFSKFERQSR